MKIVISLLSFFALLGLCVLGCNRDEKIQPETELPIVSKLPIIYGGINLKSYQTVIIKNQIGCDSILNQNELYQILELQNIDFSKYDVLLGADIYTNGIDKIEYHLIKTGTLTYTFKTKVYYDLTLIAGKFFYGIIINKLPSGVTVKFEVTKID